MTRLEKMYDELYQSDIAVNDYHFSYTKKAACVSDGNMNTIILDHSAIENSAEELTLLAEEQAHYETDTLYTIDEDYNSPQARFNRIAAEGRAKRHAINKHIPFDEMAETFEKFVYADGLDIYELAEYFDVTPEFMKRAIKLYHERGERW